MYHRACLFLGVLSVSYAGTGILIAWVHLSPSPSARSTPTGGRSGAHSLHCIALRRSQAQPDVCWTMDREHLAERRANGRGVEDDSTLLYSREVHTRALAGCD